MSRLPDPAPGDNRRWIIYLVAVAGFVISMFYRVSTGVISLDLSRELSLSAVQMGHISSAFFYAFAVSQLPLILVLGRLGPRLTMSVLSLVAVVGSVVFSLAGSYQAAVTGRALLGVGMSCHLMGTMTLLAAWFPVDRFATLSGILLGTATVGNIAAATPLALLNQAVGWRSSFLIMAVLTAVQGVVLFLVARDRPAGASPPESGGNPFKGLGRVFTMPAFFGISFATFSRYGTFVALQGLWAFPFLTLGLKMGQVEAANVILMLGVGSMLGPPLLGRLSDHRFRTRKWVAAPALAVVALVLASFLLLTPQTPRLLVHALFFLGGFCWTGPGLVLYAHIKELVPEAQGPAAMTGVNFFTMLGAAMVTEFVGFALGGHLKDINGPDEFRLVWILFAAIMASSIFLYLFIPDSRALRSDDDEEARQ